MRILLKYGEISGDHDDSLGYLTTGIFLAISYVLIA
jgi:hypothetical protein